MSTLLHTHTHTYIFLAISWQPIRWPRPVVAMPQFDIDVPNVKILSFTDHPPERLKQKVQKVK